MHLDAQGLVALWREALFAREVLRGRTTGYRQHLSYCVFGRLRHLVAQSTATLPWFMRTHNLGVTASTALNLGVAPIPQIRSTDGQLQYEWSWLLSKLQRRSPAVYRRNLEVSAPAAHPIFRVAPGPVAQWERVQ